MQKQFSTLDIVKTLEIPRERLRSWMKEGFIQPTVPAQGQGTKAVFHRYDIYGIALFRDLLDAGFRRDVAATQMREFARVFRKNYELVLYRQVTLPGGCMMHCSPVIVTDNNTFAVMAGEASFAGDVSEGHEMTVAMRSVNDISQWETFIVVNMKNLKERVDQQLSQHEKEKGTGS